MGNAILIQNGTRTVVQTDGKLESLQKFVGGYIEAAFTVPSPVGRQRSITGYVNEEGMINGQPRDFYGVEFREFNNVFNGPVIVVGLNEKTGDTVLLTDAEIEAVTLSEVERFRSHSGTFPVKVIRVAKKGDKPKAEPEPDPKPFTVGHLLKHMAENR